MDLEALLPQVSFSALQVVFETLESSDLVREEYSIVSQAEAMVFDQGVKLLLQNLSVQTSYDLEPAYLSFQKKDSPIDQGDIIDPQRRTGNFVITAMWEIQKRPSDLKTYIRNRRGNTGEKPTFQLTETMEKEAEFEGKSWIWPLITKKRTEIAEAFEEMDYKKEGGLTKNQTNDLFRETLALCELELSPEYTEAFRGFLESRWGDTNRVLLSAYFSLVDSWAFSHPQKPDFPSHLHKTIQEYEQLISSFGGPSRSTQPIQCLLDMFRVHLNAYLSKKEALRASPPQTEDLPSKSLADVFEYYAKQQRLLGPTPTFDEITENNSQWTVGKFFKFCTDRGVLGRQTEQSRKLTKEELMNVFRKTAELTKVMGIKQLKSALDEISELFYNEDYDKIAKGKSRAPEEYKPVAELPLPEKRKRLYARLKLGSPDSPEKSTERPVVKRSFPSPERLMRRPRLRNQPEPGEPPPGKPAKSADSRLSPTKARPRKQFDAPSSVLTPVRPSYSEKHISKPLKPEPLSWISLRRMQPNDLAADLLEVIGDTDELPAVTDRRGSHKEEARGQARLKAVEQRVEAGMRAAKRGILKAT